MSAVREILPGVEHWTAVHPRIRMPVSSYRLVGEGVLIDPLVPDAGTDALAAPAAPGHVLLTNRHHWRGCSELIAAFGVVVHAPRSGLHEFGSDRPVVPYDPGDELPGGAVVHEVGVLCPDEMALHVPAHGVLALADGAVRHPPDGPLVFVPDPLLGDDPAAIRAGLSAAYAQLAATLDFDTLLLAHGDPIVGDGRAALAAFAEGGGSASF